ncbi:MAG: 23S rRNA (pseudouridine(1915)-N(3))-methyltransferase RlmH [Chromatiales bacterium]|nr:23S rRNA (pseudouridine(1915)-N(3))-methyltransferase RlmH [Chromatiales bacterium]
MQIHLIAVGTKMPKWIDEGFTEYVRRMPSECSIKLHEIALPKRGKSSSAEKLREQEGKKMASLLPKSVRQVALEVNGSNWSTERLAERLKFWMESGQDIALLVGGPDGIEPTLSAHSDEKWSLSPLTLPHPLVRVVVAEQLYRAWTILKGHPYHRAG